MKRRPDRFLPSLPRPTLSSSPHFLHNTTNPPTEMALLIRGQDPCGPARVFMAPAHDDDDDEAEGSGEGRGRELPPSTRERYVDGGRERDVEVWTDDVISRNNEEGQKKQIKGAKKKKRVKETGRSAPVRGVSTLRDSTRGMESRDGYGP